MAEEQETIEAGDEEMEDCNAENEITLNAIARPLADEKLTKRLYKLVKKAAAKKDRLHRGLKNVQTKIRKGGKGICVFAGDVSPIDIYCHLPIVCEDKDIPYCFVQSKRDLAGALGAKRPCIVVLVAEDEDYKDLYDKCYNKIEKL